MFEEALDLAGLRLTHAVGERLEDILVSHLRPLHQDVLAKAKDAADTLKAYGPDPDPGNLIAAPQAERDAFGELQRLAESYAQIRAAAGHLKRLGLAPVDDTQGRLSEFKNMMTVWPTYGRGSFQSSPPWPQSSIGRLIWIVTSEAQPWLPLPEEQDQRASEWADTNRQRNTGALAGIERG